MKPKGDRKHNMPVSSMKDLLEAGVHFGHHTRKWNPKMKPYIYGARNDIYIIDLHKTRKKLEVAYDKVRQMAYEGKSFLFVGTKKQAQDAIAEAATSCNSFYVNHRWLGGMLTNWNTVQLRIDRLNQIDKMQEDGTLAKLVKKEQFRIMEERTKLDNVLGGIRTMTSLPDVIFIIDCKKEHIAIKEAHRLEIPIVAVVDTNCDPEEIDYVIPGNDDAIRAVSLMADQMAQAINEGRLMAESVREERAGQLSGAGAAHFGGGQIDYVGAENVQFSPVSNDDDESSFEEEMAKPLGEMPRDAKGDDDNSLRAANPNQIKVDDSARAAGGITPTATGLVDEQKFEPAAQTTTDQSVPTGGPTVMDQPVDGKPTPDAVPVTENEGGAVDMAVDKAVANA